MWIATRVLIGALVATTTWAHRTSWRELVRTHGAFPPRGLTRTYPHFLTQEGVFGAEYNKWTKRVTARHNVNRALTRMLLGPMDYTPGGFRNVTPEAFVPEANTPTVQTTRGHGLAMYVIYESPFQGVSDSPDNYAGGRGGRDDPAQARFIGRCRPADQPPRVALPFGSGDGHLRRFDRE